MSNALVITATTRALRHLLATKVTIPAPPGPPVAVNVTTSAPDVVVKGLTAPTLNLFLFHTVINSAFSNADGATPLALRLQYLLTAYGKGEADAGADSHTVLAAAMSALHDHPLLGTQELQDAYADSDIGSQIERLRITPLPLSIDELARLWSAFQTGYRMSVAYEVSVVLIDSQRALKAPLPVLRRGSEDRGAIVATGAAPVLTQARQKALRLGEVLEIEGESLAAGGTLRFAGLSTDARAELAPEAIASTLKARLPALADGPDAYVRWAPGFYAVSLVVGSPALLSNEVVFALAPTVTVDPNSVGAVSAPGDTITLTCIPRIRDKQRVQVLFGDRQLTPASIVNASPNSTPTQITFAVPAVPPGLWLVRLRVDGVDSMPVTIDGASKLPVFDPAQQVRV